MNIKKAIIFASLLFYLAIGFDVSPFLRGPAYYPPEWRWEYQFINTVSRVYAPLLVIAIIIALFYFTQKRNYFEKHEKRVLSFIIILGFLFQISVLFFSRAGISVLIHRIIDPELNGYFTAALPIKNAADFLRTYNQNILHFVYHAKAHPPGAILLFFFIKQFVSLFPGFISFINYSVPQHADIRHLWYTLIARDKATAAFSSFFIPFLSVLTIVPLFYCAKILYGSKIAVRSAYLFLFIPSVVLFLPINDAFLSIFSITAFYFFVRGFKNNSISNFLLSGITLFLGVFFNLSLLPLAIFFFIYFLLKFLETEKKQYADFLKKGLAFLTGFLLLPIFFFLFFHFNFIEMIQIIMKHVPDIHTRSYKIWLFYNLYDFFVFSGIPITIVLFLVIKNVFIIRRKIDFLFLSFFIMLIILDISGSVRGETGRILEAFMPFMSLIAARFATKNLKFSTKFFVVILILQAVQILVMQEFWVMLW